MQKYNTLTNQDIDIARPLGSSLFNAMRHKDKEKLPKKLLEAIAESKSLFHTIL